MILFQEGREVARTSGAMSSTQIVRWVRDRRPIDAVGAYRTDRLLAWLEAGFGDGGGRSEMVVVETRVSQMNI